MKLLLWVAMGWLTCQLVQAEQTPLLEQSRCPDCTPDEQTMVDLRYINQLLDLLSAYQSRIAHLDPQTLDYLRAYLQASGGQVALLDKFLTKPEIQDPLLAAKLTGRAQAIPVAPQRKPQATAQPKDNKPTQRRRASGIAGLSIAYVQETNPEIGREASVTIVSHKRPQSISLGNAFIHNNAEYRIAEITAKRDERDILRHYVTVENTTSGKQRVIPWTK